MPQYGYYNIDEPHSGGFDDPLSADAVFPHDEAASDEAGPFAAAVEAEQPA